MSSLIDLLVGQILKQKCVFFRFFFTFIYLLIFFSIAHSQDKQKRLDQYQIGPGEKLMIQVHVWGEVARPGEYLVPDGTNVLELISRAGGPTAFANLGKIILTRIEKMPLLNEEKKILKNLSNNSTTSTVQNSSNFQKKIYIISLKNYLEKHDFKPLPILHPGDVVLIKQNVWYRWQSIFRFLSQIAIIIQAWYWYTRISG